MRKKGFTVAELLIVIGITLVLAASGILMFTVIRTQQNSLKMDGIAKEIFIDAQNQMLSMRASGEWDNYLDDENTEFGTHMTTKPSDYDFWLNISGITEPSWETAASDMYVLSSNDKALELFNRILPVGTIDNSVRSGGTYFIEYNRKTATVYGVFYTETSSLAYNDIVSANDLIRENDSVSAGDAKVARRTTSTFGFNCTLGYYGGGITNELEVADDLQDPSISFLNGEELILQVVDPNSNTFEPGASRVTVSLTGAESHNEYVFTVDYENSVLHISDDAVGRITDGSVVTENNEIVYRFVIDSITDGMNFRYLFWEFTPGEDLVATAYVVPSGDLVGASNTVSASANSLFESKSGTTINVSQIRHLENISPVISGFDHAPYSQTLTINVTSNMSFDNRGEGIRHVVEKDYSSKEIDYSLDTYRSYSYSGSSSEHSPLITYASAGSFIPVVIPNYGTTFTFNGNGHVLYNLNINIESSEAGLFESLGYSTAEISDFGLVSYPYGSSSACAVQITDGTGPTCVGGFVGDLNWCEATFTDCYTTIPVRTSSQSVNPCVGGFVGYGFAPSVTFENCYVSCHTTSGEFTTTTNAMITIEEGADIDSSSAFPGFVGAGSFAGALSDGTELNIDSCYSNADIFVNLSDGNRMYAGGFIGSIEGDVFVSNSYYQGQVWDEGENNSLVCGMICADCYDLTVSESYCVLQLSANADSFADAGTFEGRILTNAVATTGTKVSTTHAYDSTLTGSYPYYDPTGLGHHYGDWTPIAKKTRPDLSYTKTANVDSTFDFDSQGIFTVLRSTYGLNPNTDISSVEILSTTTTAGSEIRANSSTPSATVYKNVLHIGVNSALNDNSTKTYVRFTIPENDEYYAWHINVTITVSKLLPNIYLWDYTNESTVNSGTLNFRTPSTRYGAVVEANNVSYTLPTLGTTSGLTCSASGEDTTTRPTSLYTTYDYTRLTLTATQNSSQTLTVTSVRNEKYRQRSKTYNFTVVGEYNIVFNANGGTGSMDPIRVVIETPNTLSENEFTRADYNFKGWSFTPDALNDTSNVLSGLDSALGYYDDDLYVRANAFDSATYDFSYEGETITLYAVWGRYWEIDVECEWGYRWTGTAKTAPFTVTVDGSASSMSAIAANTWQTSGTTSALATLSESKQTYGLNGQSVASKAYSDTETDNARYTVTVTPGAYARWADTKTNEARSFTWGIYVCHEGYRSTGTQNDITDSSVAINERFVSIQEAFDSSPTRTSSGTSVSHIVLDTDWTESPVYGLRNRTTGMTYGTRLRLHDNVRRRTLTGTLTVKAGILSVGSDPGIAAAAGTEGTIQARPVLNVIASQGVDTNSIYHDIITPLCVWGGTCYIDNGVELTSSANPSETAYQEPTGLIVLNGTCNVRGNLSISVKHDSGSDPAGRVCLYGVQVWRPDSVALSTAANTNATLNWGVAEYPQNVPTVEVVLSSLYEVEDRTNIRKSNWPEIKSSSASLMITSGRNCVMKINRGTGYARGEINAAECILANRAGHVEVNGGTWTAVGKANVHCFEANNPLLYNGTWYGCYAKNNGGTINGYTFSNTESSVWFNEYDYDGETRTLARRSVAVEAMDYATLELTSGTVNLWDYRGTAIGICLAYNGNSSVIDDRRPTVTATASHRINVRGYQIDGKYGMMGTNGVLRLVGNLENTAYTFDETFTLPNNLKMFIMADKTYSGGIEALKVTASPSIDVMAGTISTDGIAFRAYTGEILNIEAVESSCYRVNSNVYEGYGWISQSASGYTYNANTLIGLRFFVRQNSNFFLNAASGSGVEITYYSKEPYWGSKMNTVPEKHTFSTNANITKTLLTSWDAIPERLRNDDYWENPFGED